MGKVEIVKIVEEGNKKHIKIFGYSIWRIFAYFIIYSILGYIVETIYGIVTTGRWESRQSFLYGPFCAIYGAGAVAMLALLQYFNQNYKKLFVGGVIIGSTIEYVVSLYGEKVLNVKWWDYSDLPFNINGRISLMYAFFWGILAICLVIYINPRVDNFINWIISKISIKKLKVITLTVIILMFIDNTITGYALDAFTIRKVYEYDIQVTNKEEIDIKYNNIYGNKELSEFIYKFWNDKKMIRTFPNLKLVDKDGKIIYFDTLVGNIQPYYYKFDF